MKFTLPKPPSTNHIYGLTARGKFARMYITKKGQAWFEEAGYLVNTQRPDHKTITTPTTVSISLYTAYHQDADGVVKPIFDLLQKQGIVDDDALINHFEVSKYKSKKSDEHIEVEVAKSRLM